MILPSSGRAPRSCPWSVHLALLALLAGASLFACNRPADPNTRPPDILLLVVDTLRADRMGCYGYPRETTPAMDELAREGTVVEGVMAQSSWTLPSMVSLLSSQYITGYCDRMPEDSPALAELLKDAGYVTVAVVANGLMQPDRGFSRGFDHYYVEQGVRDEGSETPYLDAREILEQVRPALEAVEQELRTKPLFLYVHLMDPHSPYVRRPQMAELLPDSQAPPFADDDWHAQAFRAVHGELPSQWEKQIQRMARMRASYDMDLRYADQAIGELLAGLRSSGRLEHALVAIASDHGEGLYDHGALLRPDGQAARQAPGFFQLEHGMSLYEELVRTPLVLWGSGVPRGLRLEGGAENIDLVPTLLELAGVPIPPQTVGRSLVPRLLEPDSAGPELLFSWVLHAAAVREPATGWKLSVPTEAGAERGAVPGLHHLPTDPLERQNRFEEEPEIVEHLHARLVQWLEENPFTETHREPASQEFLQNLEALGYTDDSFLPPEEADGGEL